MALIAVAIGQFMNSTRQAILSGRQASFAEEQLKLAKEERIKAQEAFERASQAEQATKSLENLLQQAEKRVVEIQSALEMMTSKSGALEAIARETTKMLEAVIIQAQSAEERLRDAEERESLRVVAMMTPHGRVVVNPMGMQTYPGGIIEERHKKVFIIEEDGSTMRYAGPADCARKEYMDDIKTLIKEHPKIPYAYVALTWCLKQAGDPAWLEEGERVKKMLEKLMAIQPHVLQIDGFYGFLIRYIFKGNIEDTGYFRVGENGIYSPIGGP
jgi:hypothetical protein